MWLPSSAFYHRPSSCVLTASAPAYLSVFSPGGHVEALVTVVRVVQSSLCLPTQAVQWCKAICCVMRRPNGVALPHYKWQFTKRGNQLDARHKNQCRQLVRRLSSIPRRRTDLLRSLLDHFQGQLLPYA